MATILAHIRVKSGSEPVFERIAQTMFAASHGNERDLLRYEYYRSKTPRKYYCLLSFNNFVDFLKHQASPHHERAAKPLVEVISDLKLEWIDPVSGASPLPPTRLQPVPAAADALIRRYADMMPVEVAPSWTSLRAA